MTVTAADIAARIDGATLYGNGAISLTGVTHDSRRADSGWVFVAMPGAKVDGHAFIEAALRGGASAVVAQKDPDRDLGSAAWIRVPDSRLALGPIASEVYGNPTEELTLIGITGTNGKTTLTYLLESVIRSAGGSPGVVGTVNYRWSGSERQALHTTPEASDLQAVFAEMVRDGVTHAAVEVSSHGLELGRLEGCRFDVKVFTNLSQDHLDYHETMESYFQAKRALFTRPAPESSKPAPKAVINGDDPYGRRLLEDTSPETTTVFGMAPQWSVHPSAWSLGPDGTKATVETPRGAIRLASRLAGSFNLMNLLAAVAVCEALGLPHDAIERGIGEVGCAPGRLERVESPVGTIFVDYAHTPTALTNVLEALKEVAVGRVITVMGCGGDRDKTKRPLMGREAALGSQFVIVTSDNPRSEDPLLIIDTIVQGVEAQGFARQNGTVDRSGFRDRHYAVIPDRRQAIAWAVRNLRAGDILLVAGKGHETYQEINGVRFPFDDREVIREELRHRIPNDGVGPSNDERAS